ncbi:hypothetical protein FM112_06145 [Gulosibacter sp. 10]|nr:hypothetical protein FM112_06145 [Gulosibacter sp. 10]
MRHRVATRGFTPQVLVTLDKWPGTVDAAQAIEIVRAQLRQSGARVLAAEELGGEPPQAELRSEVKDGKGPVRGRYRLQLLHVAGDTLVLTSIATCLRTQEPAIAADLDRILGSAKLVTPGSDRA